jgi:hypothetical protein
MLVSILLALGGCSFFREDVGQPLNVDDLKLSRAENSRAALQLFGPPHRLSVGDAGMVFLYEEVDLHETQIGINLGGNRSSLFKAVAARGNDDRRLLVLFFDRQGETRAVHYQERAGESARGAALQFIFALAGVVDDEDLSAPPPIHDWGFDLLESDLPVGLNRQQNLDYGNYGLQQQATPTAAGQRTLELRSR